MWFNSHPAGLSFTQTAPRHLQINVRCAASPNRLYDILLTSENQPLWAKGFRRIVWHTTSPYDLGSIRDVHLAWIRVRERFLALEPGRRFAFSSDAMTVPFVRQMVEDIHFEPVAEGQTYLRWHVYYKPIRLLKPFSGWL